MFSLGSKDERRWYLQGILLVSLQLLILASPLKKKKKHTKQNILAMP